MDRTLPRSWGATEAEHTRSYPCDRFGEGPVVTMLRAVSVNAPPAIVYRWLCQLRDAPYSYDWIDNFGRESPRTLTPGADQLTVGKRMMSIFTLVDLTPGEQLTLQMTNPLAVRAFGDGFVTYAALPGEAPGTSRLVAKLRMAEPRSRVARARLALLAWGDLVMMRKQLLTLKALAERDTASA